MSPPSTGDLRRVESDFRRHLRWAVIWPLAAFFLAAGVLVALVLYVQDQSKRLDHTDVIIGRAHLVERLIIDRESTLRAFMITGDRRFSEAYREAGERLAPALSNLRDLIGDDPLQVARLASMQAALGRWQEYAGRQLALRRDAASAQDVPFLVLDGEASGNDLRSRIHELVEVEEVLRVQQGIRADAVTRFAFLLGLLFALLLGPALALTTAHQMRRSRQRYRDALEAQERTARSLRESEESLRESDRRKDEFLGMLSHELRNPLAAIRNSAHVLGRAALASEQDARARDVIARQADHLARLVDDLLDVKRISTGKLRLRTVALDVSQHVRETVEDIRPLFERRSISLETKIPDQAVFVNGDHTRLAQVVTNLLHNAAKFTDAGGHVSVTVESDGGQARIRVLDDGVGLAPEMQDKLFDPFVQSDRTLHRAGGGLGLGLSLVRGIAELHGGTVLARSGGFGKGTEFVVTLPTTGPRAAPAEAPALPPTPNVKSRVLIIDDNVDTVASLRDLLQLLGGHEVLVAHDGEGGIAAAREQHPDVILCDIGLPVMDGFEVARRIRLGGWAPAARLIALSGYAAPEDVERALRAGFDYHLAKPPDIDRLLALVAEAPSRLTAPPVEPRAEGDGATPPPPTRARVG